MLSADDNKAETVINTLYGTSAQRLNFTEIRLSSRLIFSVRTKAEAPVRLNICPISICYTGKNR